MLKLMAKRKRSEVKVGSSQEVNRKKKKMGAEEIWSGDEVRKRVDIQNNY